MKEKILSMKREVFHRKKQLMEASQRLSARFGPSIMPGFLIIGAQKGGTSSLHNYLSYHPQLQASFRKEVRYFSLKELYERGEEWYCRQFGYEPDSSKIRFESTPDYLLVPEVPQRIYETIPQAKLIAVLRDPVKRCVSAWSMFRDHRHDPFARKVMMKRHFHLLDPNQQEIFHRLLHDTSLDDFDACVEEELNLSDFGDVSSGLSFVRSGIYADRLQPFLNLFEQEKIMIVHSEDLRNKRSDTLNRICDFLKIKALDWEFTSQHQSNTRKNPPRISPDSQQKLYEFFEPHNEKLFSLIGRTFNWTYTP